MIFVMSPVGEKKIKLWLIVYTKLIHCKCMEKNKEHTYCIVCRKFLRAVINNSVFSASSINFTTILFDL